MTELLSIAERVVDRALAGEQVEAYVARSTSTEVKAYGGEVESLMKGSLHTDELMGAIVSSKLGLRTGRRVSHVFLLDVPAYPRPLMITDAAINIYPELEVNGFLIALRRRANSPGFPSFRLSRRLRGWRPRSGRALNRRRGRLGRSASRWLFDGTRPPVRDFLSYAVKLVS